MAINNGLDNSLGGQSGTGSFVGTNGATLSSANIGTPTAGVLTNCTGLPVTTGLGGLGTGVANFLVNPTSANLLSTVTDETGSGSLVFNTSPSLVTPVIGTPTSGTLTNCTGLPVSTGISGLGTGIATFLSTPTSANLAAAMTDETGTGALVFANTPALVTPNIGVATATSINFSGTIGIIGTTTNNNATAGSVGEIIESTVSPVTLTSNIVTNLGSISLTAGDWDVWATPEYKTGSGSNVVTNITAAISTVSATLPTDPNGGAYLLLNLPFTNGLRQCIPLGIRRLSLASTTTVYLVSSCTFSVDYSGYGYIGARRRR